MKLQSLQMNVGASETRVERRPVATYRVEIGVTLQQGWVLLREADGTSEGELLLSFDTKEEADAALAKVHARQDDIMRHE
jgi:hypothetical protein